MAIDLREIEKNAEKIASVSDEIKRKMHYIADVFNDHMHDLITDPDSLLNIIDTRDLKTLLNDITVSIERLKEEIDDVENPVDLQVPIIWMGIDIVCLHERLMRDIRKVEEQRKLELEKQEDLEDLEFAKPIFESLKGEVKKWVWGDNFDEYSIYLYVQEMLCLAKKHNVELGIDKGIEEERKEEIPTTYATELEALEEVEEE